MQSARSFFASSKANCMQPYGSRLSVPVTIQRESARAATVLVGRVRSRGACRIGWQIALSETRISPEAIPGNSLDMIVSGKVDRVELHPELGARLMDFKTYSPTAAGKGESKSVEDYHLTKLKRTENAKISPALDDHSKQPGRDCCRWTDLQLPLYHLAMERHFPGRSSPDSVCHAR
jgi:hypothetical protein